MTVSAKYLSVPKILTLHRMIPRCFEISDCQHERSQSNFHFQKCITSAHLLRPKTWLIEELWNVKRASNELSDELMMEPCCALKYYPAVEVCQNEKVVTFMEKNHLHTHIISIVHIIVYIVSIVIMISVIIHVCTYIPVTRVSMAGM